MPFLGCSIIDFVESSSISHMTQIQYLRLKRLLIYVSLLATQHTP